MFVLSTFYGAFEQHCGNVDVGDKRKPLLWEHLVYVKSKSEKRGKSKVSMTWSLFNEQCSQLNVQKGEHEKQWQQSDLLRDADSFQMGFP